MKKTLLALAALVVGALVLEAVALSDPNDDVWTITAAMRAIPCWGVLFIGFGSGVLVDHFWIRSWNR